MKITGQELKEEMRSAARDQNSSTEIWRERHQIESARREKLREAMEEYDRTVYIPAKTSLRQRCEVLGHVRGQFHANGFGWSWYYCNQCGARFEIIGPDISE